LRPPQFFQAVNKRNAQRETRDRQSDINEIHIHPLQIHPIANAMPKPPGDIEFGQTKRARQLPESPD
jgi:hypothetical protein